MPGMADYEQLQLELKRLEEVVGQLKLTEKVLQQERRRAQKYLDLAGVMFVAVNTRGEVTLVNRKTCEVLGYEQTEILGRNWFDNFLPQRLREEVRSVAQRLLAGEMETVEYFENPVLTKSGEERMIAWHNSVLKDEYGNVTGTLSSGEDITQRRQAEEALRQKEQQYQTLFRDSGDAIYIATREGDYIDVNDSFVDLYGYTREEIKDLKAQSVWVNPSDRSRFFRELEAHGTVKDFEAKLKRKDGTGIDGVLSSTALRSPNGTVIGSQGMVRDITQQKQLEESLRESEAANKQIAQENAVIAEIGRIISSSPNIEEVYDRFAEEVARLISFDRIAINIHNSKNNTVSITYASGVEVPERQAGDVIPVDSSFIKEIFRTQSSLLLRTEELPDLVKSYPTIQPIIQAGFRSMMSIPLILNNQVMGILHFRSKKPNAYSEADMRLAERVSSQIAGAIANAQLWAERKEAEEALRKSEQKFQELFDQAPVGYMELDSQGRISHVNRTELDLLGYYAEEMLGQPIWNFIVEEEMARQSVTAKLAGAIPLARGFERTFRRKDGKTLPFLIEETFNRDAEGNVKGLNTTHQDITERKRAEKEMADLQEQLRQSQKMEAIGQLAGGIAHDFNNALTVILGNAQLALADVGKNDPLYSTIEEIKKAGERASNLTRQLLAFSRKQILRPEILNLNQLVSGMEKMLRRIIGEDIELATDLVPDLSGIEADPGQIEQVLMNLAVNARDAMPEGGKLTIETRDVELDDGYARTHIDVTPGSYVMLAVSDTGIGMTREVQARIFEPFFTTKEKGEGTGLGLPTVYGILKQSRGNICVYSELGNGATFKIYLPRAEKAAPERESASREVQIPHGSETVLAVEDEEMVRNIVLKSLYKYGYKVLAASDGEEALRICKEHDGPIHLMLTDVIMPGMSGKELARQAKELRPDLKVFFMSGYTDNAIVKNGILEKGIAFIQKPFTHQGLAWRVRGVLDE
jgi:two-component system cell cycle sensor histidine kinase/response regulator CckA